MKYFLLIAGLVMALFAKVPAAEIQNRVLNPGFEQGLQNWLLNSKANPQTLVVASEVHSGQKAFQILNSPGTGPTDSLEQKITGLLPDTEYELSVWVQSVNARNCNLQIKTKSAENRIEKPLPLNAATWQRVGVAFKTETNQTTAHLKISIGRLTEALRMDDVAVVEASQPHQWVYAPVLKPADQTQSSGFTLAPGAYTADAYDGTEDIAGSVTFLPTANAVGGRVTLFSKDATGQETPLGSVPIPAVTGKSAMTVPFCLAARLFSSPGGALVARLDGIADPVASIDIQRRNLAEMIPSLIKDAAARLILIQNKAASCGMASNAYVRLGLNVATRYSARVQQASIRTLQEDYWTWLQLKEIGLVLDATEQLLQSPLPDVLPIPATRPKVNQGVLVNGNSKNATPVFFGGYASKENDYKNLPGLGVSAMEIEMGPRALDENGRDPGHNLDRLLKMFKLADQAKIKILFQLSPHYFPDWAMKAAPDVTTEFGTTFLKFNIDHPVARKAVEQWLKTVIPAVKTQPALLDVCLANEPEYRNSGRDAYSKVHWIAWLKQRHGTIDTLNQLYGTSYRSFTDVPPPPIWKPKSGDPIGKRRAYYDWGTFNDTHFADWFRWMNSLIKEAAPELLTHAKIMAVHGLDDGIGTGIDPEEFSDITDLAGCDDYCYEPGYSEVGGWADSGAGGPASILYAYGWQTEEITYDLLRSFRHQPVINSENHFIPDNHVAPISGEYVRSVMWQGALHGQAATSLWIFREAGKTKKTDSGGSIYYRPADVFGAGRAWLDARRCASQVAAVVRATPHVAILYSRNSIYWQDDYIRTLTADYTALTFMGVPVTFVTEKQLAKGADSSIDTLILPHVNHVADATVSALTRFAANGGKLIAMGNQNLLFDEYNRARILPADYAPKVLPVSDDERVVFQQLAPLAVMLSAPESLLDAKTGARVFGVEYRIMSDQGHNYLSALNHLKQDQIVRLPETAPAPVRDLLSGNLVDAGNLRLVPMVPVLLDLGLATDRK